MTHRTAALAARVLSAVALLLPISVARGEDRPAWAATQPDGGTVRIAIPAPKNPRFAHLAWPKVVRAADGTIVVGYLAGAYHGGTGCPAVSISTDQGKTFSEPQILREFGEGKDYFNSGNLGLAVADDGSIALLAMAHTGDKANNIFGWRSSDEGRTWQPVETPTLGPNKTGSVTCMTNVKGLGLVAVGHYRAGSKPQATGIWFASSSDNGKTWGEPRPVNDVAGAEPVLIQVPKATPDGGDRLIVFIRSKSLPQARQYIAVSDDLGKTWTTKESPFAHEKKGTLAHPFGMVNPVNPQELLVLTAERPLPGKVWLWRGDAKSLDFTRERVVLDFPKIAGDKNTDYGYTWLLPTDAGRGLMFYYHGESKGRSEIWVADISLEPRRVPKTEN